MGVDNLDEYRLLMSMGIETIIINGYQDDTITMRYLKGCKVTRLSIGVYECY